jgi:hypothetical protein
MTLHDPFARLGYRWAGRVRWIRTRRALDRVVLERPGPGDRVRARYRRELASIERRLAADAPVLSSKLAMFNQLTAGEPSAGVERLSPPAWPRPRRAHLAVLLVLAAIVTLCIALSAQVRPAVHPCQVAASAGTSAYAPVRALGCPAYARACLKSATHACHGTGAVSRPGM